MKGTAYELFERTMERTGENKLFVETKFQMAGEVGNFRGYWNVSGEIINLSGNIRKVWTKDEVIKQGENVSGSEIIVNFV